jgi:7,8-dihydropterin-6-yl-methyl-4-(beta-D-ribofuranosyl)aminobenzene 5'-phosphate synthase
MFGGAGIMHPSHAARGAAMSHRVGSLTALSLVLLVGAGAHRGPAAPRGNRVTILYDAFGIDASMRKDWGYAALVEYDGRRILFDTGNNPEIFAHNIRAAGVDLRTVDFVVLSHRHLDHTAGLDYLLRVNPNVIIYAPRETFGPFGSALPSAFYRKDDSLPAAMRYYDGYPPDTMAFGTAWPKAHFILIDSTRLVAPGVRIVSLVSDASGTKELRELSLVLETPDGAVVVVGCSHPGIERIVQAASGLGQPVHMVFGGFHLPAASDSAIARVAAVLHDTYRVARLAPGHCTGEPAFRWFKQVWQRQYVYAGVGSVIPLP